MIISVITLFPQMFVGPFDSSILKRAGTTKKVDIQYINLRDFATDKYKSVDDHPYGGGVGMILRVDVLDRAIQYAKEQVKSKKSKVILLDPQGIPFTQKKARTLSRIDHLILVCGHYEGIDERVRKLVDEEISIGDYILTGGEIPAMVIVDSVVRLMPGVLSKTDATRSESFETGRLEYPQYTKPQIYKGNRVPAVLLTGNHAAIATWQELQAKTRTRSRRPDLLRKN